MGKCLSRGDKDGGNDKIDIISVTSIKSEYVSNNKHLIVDDSKNNRFIMKKYLQKGGIICVEACDGREAIELIKTHKTFDIVWMDVQMPILNGIECTRALRNELNYTGKIIGLTGCTYDESIKQCKEAGMDEVITKPSSESIIYSFIK